MVVEKDKNEEPESEKKDIIYLNICKLHREISRDLLSVKYIADLWYNILKESGLSDEELSTNDTLKAYLSKYVECKLKKDKKAQHFIIKIAKQVCKDELDHIMEGSHPIVDLEHKKMAWVIKDLYTALYFALYYFDPETQQYIQCGREKCKRYFLTSKESPNTYCSDKCASAESSRLYRERKKAARSAEAESIPDNTQT